MNNRNTITLFKWVWRAYIRTTLVPLILIELFFVAIYFMTTSWSNMKTVYYLQEESMNDLKQIAVRESNGIEQKLIGISNAVLTFDKQIERALSKGAVIDREDEKRLTYSSDGVYYTKQDREDGGAAIFYSGIVPVGAEEREKVTKVLTKQELMKDIIHSEPLAASIYLNTYDSLNIIYPYVDAITQYEPKTNIPSFNFYYEADKNHNPLRKVKWTDVYLDPAGHGWIVSSLSPVYNGDKLEGVVGIDVTVENIANQISQIQIPWDGYGVLIGKDGMILALPNKGEKDFGITELSNYHYREAIIKDTFESNEFNLYNMNGLFSFAKELSEKSEGFAKIKIMEQNKVVSWATIADTGWKLLVVVPEKNIYANISKMRADLYNIGYYIIAGLFLFYFYFFYIITKKAKKVTAQISKPLLAINEMVQKIGKGIYFQHELDFNVKELNETALNLVNMGKQLGLANNELISTQNQLKKREKDLQSLVNSIDDIIIKINDKGKVLKTWTNDEKNLSKVFLEGASCSIEDILDETSAKLAMEKILRVAETKGTESMEYILETGNGYRWFQARIALIEDETGALVVTARDITERKEMIASIMTSKEEAEKASRAKSEFLSSMSHELRTPLNAIIGFSQLLEMDSESQLDDAQRQNVIEILKAGNHLLELINEVLDLAKIESGKMDVSMEPLQVKPVMEETLSLIKPLADKKDIEIEYRNFDNNEAFVLGDRTRLKQVLINLLSNAIKYNKEKGKVNYYCEIIQNSIRINVIDNGFGIHKDHLRKIFEPFHRLQMTSSSVEGTGIGLTVARQLMELMNGSINVESMEGVGSHFWIELPLSDPIFELKEVKDISAEYKENFHIENTAIRKILYVEDNPANLKLIERIIGKIQNVEMRSAASGEMSIELARGYKPDVILLDINLPDMSGYEVFERLKCYEETSHIKVIAVSANAMDKDIKRGLDFGFTDYITKPIKIPEFIEKILNILKEK